MRTNCDIKNCSTMTAAETAQYLPKIHSADAIDLLNDCDIDKITQVIQYLDMEYAVQLFDKPELLDRNIILTKLPDDKAITILNEMSADQASDVYQAMDERTRKYLFPLISSTTRAEINKLSNYAENSAGSLMTTEFISVPSNWSVSQVLNYIKEVQHTRETVYSFYVIDPRTSELLKVVSLRRLMLAKENDNILEIADDIDPVTINPYTNREDLARLFRRHDLLSVPVLDGGNHVIGIVTVDDVLDSMTEEMSEDTYKFGGMEALDKSYVQMTFVEMLKKRAGWLCILFLSEMLTASAMQYFSDELSKATVLSLFIPLIMSSGGNSGSQATSLIIRAIALRELNLKNWFKVLLNEASTGVVLGLLLGSIIILRILLWQFTGLYDYGSHYLIIATTVCLALIGVVAWGTLSGAMLPFILKKLGFDPASASAPFVATIVDVTGIVIYLSIAMITMRGTLL